MATRFIIRPSDDGWDVLIDSPWMAEAAIVKRLKERSRASAFVQEQLALLRKTGETATVHYQERGRKPRA